MKVLRFRSKVTCFAAFALILYAINAMGNEAPFLTDESWPEVWPYASASVNGAVAFSDILSTGVVSIGVQWRNGRRTYLNEPASRLCFPVWLDGENLICFRRKRKSAAASLVRFTHLGDAIFSSETILNIGKYADFPPATISGRYIAYVGVNNLNLYDLQTTSHTTLGSVAGLGNWTVNYGFTTAPDTLWWIPGFEYLDELRVGKSRLRLCSLRLSDSARGEYPIPLETRNLKYLWCKTIFLSSKVPVVVCAYSPGVAVHVKAYALRTDNTFREIPIRGKVVRGAGALIVYEDGRLYEISASGTRTPLSIAPERIDFVTQGPDNKIWYQDCDWENSKVLEIAPLPLP